MKEAMSKITFSLIFVLMLATPVFAQTSYTTTLGNGDTLTMSLSAETESTASGHAEVRTKASWTESGGWGSITGSSYAFAWSNYEKGNGELYENEPSHGASMVIFFAFPNASCSNGVLYFAAIEMSAATSASNLGGTVTFIPLFGQICGAQINKLATYTLTAQAPSTGGNSTAGSSSSGTSTSGPSSGATSASVDFGGLFNGTAGACTYSVSQKQSGGSLAGGMAPTTAGGSSCSGSMLTYTGSVKGSTALVGMSDSTNQCRIYATMALDSSGGITLAPYGTAPVTTNASCAWIQNLWGVTLTRQ